MLDVQSSQLPAQLDFAKEVRADRLTILWKITLVGVGILIWLVITLNALNASAFGNLLFALVTVGISCILTASFLRQSLYTRAVWAYIGGLIVGSAILMVPSVDAKAIDIGRHLVPFIFPLIVILVGLMLPSRATLIVMIVTILLTLFVPSINQGAIVITREQLFATLMVGLAGIIAAQTSGQLYGIAEWALESYHKERKMKDELFDTQQEVQRSFMRQKALTEQLQHVNNELEVARSAALEAKNFRGQFLANMSHELRTPLNAIIGFSETMLNYPMMYDNQTLPTAYRGDMTQIYNSGKHLLQLINDILDLSKVDAGKLDLELEAVELDPVFKSVLSTATGLVGDKPIRLLRETPPNLPKVRCDPLRLRQVILNLLSNAAKFTDQGSITLGARETPNGEVMIWIRDTGIGITPQDMNSIFEEFRQGSSGRRKGRAGSGLGLAISKQLLGLMGGRIWVESVLGQGSIFYFTLPVYTVEAVQQ